MQTLYTSARFIRWGHRPSDIPVGILETDFQVYYRPRSGEIIELVASVRPSVRLSVCLFVCMFVRALPAEPFRSHYQSSGVCLCVCNQWAYAGNCA